MNANSKAPLDMYFKSVVRPEQDGKLLLDILSKRFTYHSVDEWIQKLNDGLVTINGELANINTIAHRDATIVYHVLNYSEPDVPTNYSIVFEDDEFMLIAKPAGVPVHHTGHIFYNTFVAIVRRTTGFETATPMHRLDRDTGGLMLFAKYAETAARFQKNLDRILLRKFYMAVVRGNFSANVDCQMPLREDKNDTLRVRMHYFKDGKPCHTLFKKIGSGVLNNGTTYSVVEAELITGRKHQIRAHLAELGFPIIGDRLYSFNGIYYEKMSLNSLNEADFEVLGAKTQMLYAYKAEIQLPYWDTPRTFEYADYPPDMLELVKNAKK